MSIHNALMACFRVAKRAALPRQAIVFNLGNFMINALDNASQTRGWSLRLQINHHGVYGWDSFSRCRCSPGIGANG